MKFDSNNLKEMSRAVKFGALSALQASRSGHFGIIMSASDIVTTVYANFLDGGKNKFVLSAGHGSAMLYSVLKLTGAEIGDLKSFRKIGGLPGHPERHTNGVWATTGPLGAGVSNAVGMAMAAKIKSEDSIVYCLAGDGDLSEGVAAESIDFAGRYKLNNLVLLWDDNNVTIDGYALTAIDMVKKMSASGWTVLSVDGHNFDELNSALEMAKKSDKPTFVACKTIIGNSSSLSGKPAAHGFDINPTELLNLIEKNKSDVGIKLWANIKINYEKKSLPRSDDFDLKDLSLESVISTRELSGLFLQKIMSHKTGLIGGSADLGGSTNVKFGRDITADNFGGNYINYGVREHAMGGIVNGLCIGGLRAFSSTFLVFSDYMKPAIRIAALSGIPAVYVLTHDSIMVGEDGPTHQPIEQIASLRLIPNLHVFRPCNQAEVLYAWQSALDSVATPTAIVLSRQKFKQIMTPDRTKIEKGAYIIYGAQKPRVTIIATGSEVPLAVDVAKKIGSGVQVVSMLSVDIFRRQSEKYKSEICRGFVVAIEAGATASWFEFADAVVGLDDFGESGAGENVYKKFGFDADLIADEIIKKIK